MAVSLAKGGNVSLSKEAPGLSRIMVGLGWDAQAADDSDFDLDAVAFLLGSGGKVRGDLDFIYYGNKVAPDGSVTHTGDNLTGAGDGDDESILIELQRLGADVDRIAVCVTIHEAENRRQNFGMVRNAFIRIVDSSNEREIARFDLSEDAGTHAAMIFGEIYRHGGEWKFRALGQSLGGGLAELARSYGVAT